MTTTAPYRDIAVTLANRAGSLADFGRIIGEAGVSLEGGGVFTHDGTAIAHFLVDDADRARTALAHHGLGPVSISHVVTVHLDQGTPGQLGAFAHRLAEARINILVQYSDHDHRLVLVVAAHQYAACQGIAATWEAQRTALADAAHLQP